MLAAVVRGVMLRAGVLGGAALLGMPGSGLAGEPIAGESVAVAGAPLLGETAESYLASADVLAMKPIPKGITKPRQVVLSNGHQRLRAVWKTIDELTMVEHFERALPELRFRDSYKHEVAAYELDKLLGLGLVPPTVERHIGRKSGSLQLWIEGAMTDSERRSRGLKPDDVVAWNRQMHTVRLFHQLTYDTDYNNVSNLLVDARFKLWVIDSSRAFRYHHQLRKESSLFRFSSRVLERLRALDPDQVRQRLGRWLDERQIEALLARRDLIVAHADDLVARAGEAAILFD